MPKDKKGGKKKKQLSSDDSSSNSEISRNSSYESLNDRYGNIEIINSEIEHLSYQDRLDVLREVYESVGPSKIFESSDGSRFDPNILSNDVLFRIRSLVQNRSAELDITTGF